MDIINNSHALLNLDYDGSLEVSVEPLGFGVAIFLRGRFLVLGKVGSFTVQVSGLSIRVLSKPV